MMPSYSTAAFDNFFEPRARKSLLINDSNNEERVDPPPAPEHVFISPELYVTPAPAQIPETPGCDMSDDDKTYKARPKRPQLTELVDDDVDSDSDDDVAVENVLIDEVEGENEGFLDPRLDDVSSVGSVSEAKAIDCRSFASAPGDFFDAIEDFSSEGSSLSGPFNGPNFESELRTTKLQLLEEIERRKTAENALCMMRRRWQNISNVLSQAGLTLPSPSDVIDGLQFDNTSIEQLAQELIVTRFVAEAIGRGQTRAEAELAAEELLASKDQEISRLRDRLRYYEAVNQEMAQRNRENIEIARIQRQQKRAQRKWLWSCIGLTTAVGISLVAYKYMPKESKHLPISNPSGSTADVTSETA